MAPASVGQYIRFFAAAMLSMALGAQLVHGYYKPMEDLHLYIENEVSRLPLDMQRRINLALEAEKQK